MAMTKKTAVPETSRNAQSEEQARKDWQNATPWPDFVPLADTPEADPFPLDVLPDDLQRFVAEAADAFPCPPDYLAVPLLVMAGGHLGASRVLAVKDGHVQRARPCTPPSSARPVASRRRRRTWSWSRPTPRRSGCTPIGKRKWRRST
jgi:hypothetical protein